MPFQHLALELQSHQKEEDCHQAVVDPEEKGLGEGGGPDPDLHLEVEERRIERVQRRVGHDQADGGRKDEDDATGGLEAHELRQGPDRCL